MMLTQAPANPDLNLWLKATGLLPPRALADCVSWVLPAWHPSLLFGQTIQGQFAAGDTVFPQEFGLIHATSVGAADATEVITAVVSPGFYHWIQVAVLFSSVPLAANSQASLELRAPSNGDGSLLNITIEHTFNQGAPAGVVTPIAVLRRPIVVAPGQRLRGVVNAIPLGANLTLNVSGARLPVGVPPPW